jgi:hypothetical protein
VAKVSIIIVPIAESIAMKPVNGKFPHGFWLRQGLVKLSNASGNTWMNPVASITPAAKALIMKKISFSGRKVGIFLPNIGRETPIALAIRIELIATSLNLRAFALSRPCESSLQVHSAETKMGTKSKRRRRVEDRASFLMAFE